MGAAQDIAAPAAQCCRVIPLLHLASWLPGRTRPWLYQRVDSRCAGCCSQMNPNLGRANQLAPFHGLEGTLRQHRYLVSPIWLHAGRWSPSKTSGIGQHRSLIVAVPTSPPSLHPGCPYNLARSTLRSRASHPPISGTYSSRHAPARPQRLSLTTSLSHNDH